MTVPRIYVPRDVKQTKRLELGKENLRYVRSVLRMKKGDPLMLFDGTGWEYETVIDQISADGVVVEVIKKKNCSRGNGIRITLMQSLPKAGKMDFIVQKATELGVDRIVPFQSERSVPRLSSEKTSLRIKRWQSIAVEAVRQCGRPDIPEVSDILSFEDAISGPGHDTWRIIFWEEESVRGIRDLLRDKRYDGMTNISVVIGPEGGFTKEEVARAVEKGFISVSLGKQVLKVDTAVLAILSIIQYQKGIFGGMMEKGKAE
ncbi:MAG: 16S rRNA (uracil(1498)-N(3))-methyltransferase [Deltaproteobacteria bacterium]|nr:16S rRNA (uracil(1498)-N(3))-methyltransferase [Deltaproteobacteria bacterium]